MGKHYTPNCQCPNELPVNKACAACVKALDIAKEKAVEEALEKIVDLDPKKA